MRLKLIGCPPSSGGGNAPSITAFIGNLLIKSLPPANEKLGSFLIKMEVSTLNKMKKLNSSSNFT